MASLKASVLVPGARVSWDQGTHILWLLKTAVTVFLHCCYTVVALLLHYLNTAVTLLLVPGVRVSWDQGWPVRLLCCFYLLSFNSHAFAVIGNVNAKRALYE
jgi:hypothetical protein